VLAAERHRVILDRLREEDVITTAAIARVLGVSEMTVRRDLASLERRGLLRRVHGGAQALPSTWVSTDGQPSQRQPVAKQQVGARAAALVQDGETLFLDAGATCMEVARAFKDRALRGLHVLTHAVNIATELAGHPGITVIQLGGEVIGGTYAATGPTTVSAVEQFSFDRAFVSAQGLHPTFGLTCSSLLEVEIKRAVLRRSRYSVLVIDASKWHRQAMIRFAALGELQAVVSDAGFPEEARRSLKGAGVEVFVPP
jgi:DeoR/GlpR family transcriptional regulator of sugar metabolism